MAQLFKIDLCNVPTQEERFQIAEQFRISWEVTEHWESINPSQKILSYIEVFWPYNTLPVLPALPEEVNVIKR